MAASDALERMLSWPVLRLSGVPKGFEKFYQDKKKSGGSSSPQQQEESKSGGEEQKASSGGDRPKEKLEDPPARKRRSSSGAASSGKGDAADKKWFFLSSERPKTGGSGGKEGSGGGGGFSDEDKQKIIATLGLGAIALSMIAGMNYLSYREISWKEFVNNYLARGTVDKLVVVNGKWVKVFLTDGAGGGSTSEQLFFTIGSVDTFQRMLENAQQELQLDSSR